MAIYKNKWFKLLFTNQAKIVSIVNIILIQS